MTLERVRARDISGNRFSDPGQTEGATVIYTQRGPQYEPPPGSREFIVSFSVLAAGGGVATALFTLDGAGNIVVPSAAIQLPADNVARISGVLIEGDTNIGAPILTFSIRDRAGSRFMPGWEGIGLPGRGGIVAVGIEPQTVIAVGQFFGGWVVNTDPGPKYAGMMLQGWMY